MLCSFIIASFLIGIMGFAIQRGGTCTVAAVEELIEKRRANRLTALCKTAFLVASIIILARAMGLSMLAPVGYPITLFTILGGALLGFGAYVNQGCMFGAIAHFGSGEWSYIATPIGFLVGAWLFYAGLHPMVAQEIAHVSFLLQLPMKLTVPLAGLLWIAYLWQIFFDYKTQNDYSNFFSFFHLAKVILKPGHATVIIGVSSILMTLLIGQTWAYTNTLIEITQGTSVEKLIWPLLFFLALLVGAFIGGISGKGFSHTLPDVKSLLRCLLGGILMSVGSLMIPGSNDGLSLIGLPMFWPYAWVAFISMCTTIAIALRYKPYE